MRPIFLSALWNSLLCLLLVSKSEILPDRIRGTDEPQLVSYRVLEGVTEPFASNRPDQAPAWKVMKMAADQKAAKQMIQQALQEYGQLLKHPYMFGEMPMDERYDIFLSMAKLLKMMGFLQKAELLLYEAMSYTREPYGAHLQLGLIFLDKEDLEKSKMHLKNCLYYNEGDVLVLISMSVILMAEGKIHEAKFYVSRVLAVLEARVQKFSFLYPNNAGPVAATLRSESKRDYSALTAWLEELLVSVFHGEYRLLPAAVVESLLMFSHLYDWLNDGELTGRYVFDLGQSLYEGGRPGIGSLMMQRGAATTNAEVEGEVSREIVLIRVALDYPVIPESLTIIIDSYLNMTLFLQSKQYLKMDIDNCLDVYWPVPNIYWSALPIVPIIQNLMLRFHGGPERRKPHAQIWLNYTKKGVPLVYDQPLLSSDKIELGIFGGHINNHPIGQMVLYRLLADLDTKIFRITLIATPLKPDEVTKSIAALVDDIVNLPLDTYAAWRLIDRLALDVVLFPDWQPFPDQQALLFQSRRIAPVQICFFVRGSSCVMDAIDYYLLPAEIYSFYHNADAVSHFDDSNSWLRPYTEQVVVIDFPIFTNKAVHKIAESALKLVPTVASSDDLRFTSSEVEGRIFFDGQPVAVIAAHPIYCHPLMDEVIFRLMHSCPSLQVVIAISSSFFDHEQVPRHRMNWGRKFIRRLWARGGVTLHQRIRLLPLPIEEKRMLQLLRAADLVLDPFPIGSVLHANALALSVGTPVVVMNNGIFLPTPKSDLSEVRGHLRNTASRFISTSLYQTMMRSNNSGVGNIPWSPTLSPLAGFYSRLGLARELVANSTNDYFNIASKLANDREYAYHIRVKLLDALDGKSAADTHNRLIKKIAKDRAARQERAAQQGEDFYCDDCEYEDNSFDETAHHASEPKTEKEVVSEEGRGVDLNSFLVNVANPWAHIRIKR